MTATSTEFTVFERHESNVRSYCRSFPVVFERAAGHRLWDGTGRGYVDLLCGAGALNYGHNPPAIVARVMDYLARGGPVQSLDLHTVAKAEFLDRFTAQILEPRGFGEYVVQFPGPAGTIAVEAALKLARKVTGRREVIAFGGGFHGASLGALAATSSPLLRGAAGVPLRDVTILPYGGTGVEREAITALERALRPGSAMAPPAAILLETVQGEGGLHTASPAWLLRVRELADAVGALVVVDDIQAGCGRTGTFFSFEDTPGLRPDLVCLSKSLSGMGLPMAALLIRRAYDQWAPGEHNGTFRGHNLAFVGATAALDFWADPRFGPHVGELGEAIRSRLSDIVAELPSGAAEIVGRGTMSGLRFADSGTADRVQRNLFRASVVAETSGRGHVLKLLPPLTMTMVEWKEVADTLVEVVTETVNGSRILPTG
jgi:diaminobutyrate-2-oxoglutarate transaminase